MPEAKLDIIRPGSPQLLAEALADAGASRRMVRLGGAFTKDAIGGPLAQVRAAISTSALNQVLQYEPQDLTISVGAGMPYCDLRRLLEENRQMLPLDPPFSAAATIGGVVASNSSGPRRRQYGTARDMVIGMTFATMEGKLVQSGGMVVKNVAGLDMAKLLIGSFGTLAAIATVNFKLVPMPARSRTFLFVRDSAAEALAERDRILRGVLHPAAIDLLNPAAAGRAQWVLAVQAGGNDGVTGRWSAEFPGAEVLDGGEEENFWTQVREFVPNLLAREPGGAVVRVSTTLSGVQAVLESASGPAISRAGAGVCHAGFRDARAATAWAREAAGKGWKAVVEYSPPALKPELDLWPAPGGDLETMRRIKAMFDPDGLLNPGRLYGRI